MQAPGSARTRIIATTFGTDHVRGAPTTFICPQGVKAPSSTMLIPQPRATASLSGASSRLSTDLRYNSTANTCRRLSLPGSHTDQPESAGICRLPDMKTDSGTRDHTSSFGCEVPLVSGKRHLNPAVSPHLEAWREPRRLPQRGVHFQYVDSTRVAASLQSSPTSKPPVKESDARPRLDGHGRRTRQSLDEGSHIIPAKTSYSSPDESLKPRVLRQSSDVFSRSTDHGRSRNQRPTRLVNSSSEQVNLRNIDLTCCDHDHSTRESGRHIGDVDENSGSSDMPLEDYLNDFNQLALPLKQIFEGKNPSNASTWTGAAANNGSSTGYGGSSVADTSSLKSSHTSRGCRKSVSFSPFDRVRTITPPPVKTGR